MKHSHSLHGSLLDYGKRYPTLTGLLVLDEILGWAGLAVGIILAVLNWTGQRDARMGFLYLGGGMAWLVLTFAIVEGSRVLLDIEQNTRSAVEAMSCLNANADRPNAATQESTETADIVQPSH